MSSTVNQYIIKRAEKGSWKFNRPIVQRLFDFVIVIPAYDEADYLPLTLESIAHQNPLYLQHTLVVVVVNSASSSSELIKQNNSRLLTWLEKSEFQFTIRWIDATSAELALPDRSAGVGLARKIGLDYCLPYVHTDSLLFCLDGDSPVAPEYLETVKEYFDNCHCIAAVIGFRHTRSDDPIIEKAMRHYEHYLKDTARKIQECNSPFGYPAVGSTIVCTARAYSAVGGMSKKTAGEDFYFLQELAKYRSVHWIDQTLVFPSARLSERVHLGTGVRLQQAMEGLDLTSLYYSNRAFDILKEWLTLALSSRQIPLNELLIRCREIDTELGAFLLSENISRSWQGLQQSSPSQTHFERQFHRWFDGLKTMRLLKTFSREST